MNRHSTIWRLIIILLSFSIKPWPLLLAVCQENVGYLTVEPASTFLLGSNLTVYCHITKCEQRAEIWLDLNNLTKRPWRRVNCTTAIFHLFNVQSPKSVVYCVLQNDNRIFSAQELNGGLRPNKPANIICETSWSSVLVDCSWERGRPTYLPTAYNISVKRENGTQILLNQVQDTEKTTIPRAMIDKNTKYELIITAYNHLGTSQSDPVILFLKDIVIPETPHIMQITFVNNSRAAMLQWKINESSGHLSSYVQLRANKGPWDAGRATELSEGLIQVGGLEPLTEYEFQMRTCNLTSGLTHASTLRSATRKRLFCSKWSPSMNGRSPGKGPSQQLHVWRALDALLTNGSRMVTVLWKPLPPEDYSGEVQQYKIFLGKDHKQPETCGAALSRCLVHVPAEIQALSVSAVTSYGMSSPPANVPLRHSGDLGPVLRELAPATNGSAVFVSWSLPGDKHGSTPGGELLHYVLEWTSVPAAELQWKKVAKSQNSTSITGLTAGMRYNVSAYAVTTRGVSAPSSSLVYSKELKPVSGPTISGLVHKARRLLIKWDELPVEQQRGFITYYTIYVEMLDSRNAKPKENNDCLSPVTVSGDSREKWLDCPEGALAVQLTASTSAGEGPRGSRMSSQPETIAVGPVIGVVFIIILPIAIIANLMCWSCVRERIKHKCISWGPDCFDEKPPKPGNSFAIRLLEQDGNELLFPSTDSDPPLSPISFISQEERDVVYPNIHVEIYNAGSGEPTAETSLLTSHPGITLVDSQLEDVGYKPQVATLAPHGEDMMETDEEQRDLLSSGEEDSRTNVFGEGFLSSVEVDSSDAPLGLTLSSVRGLLWAKIPETTASVLSGGLLLGMGGSENDVDSPSLDLRQGDKMTRDTADMCLSQDTVETTLSGGYFPQVAVVRSTTLCDTRMDITQDNLHY